MNIYEKLNLQQQYHGVLLFREGLFLRAYNESAFILTQILKHNLKLKFYKAKKANNKWIVMCAFPCNKLNARVPNSVKTDFGYHLAGNFNLTDYSSWFKQRCYLAQISNGGGMAGTESLQTHEQPAPTTLSDQKPTRIQLSINVKQLNYLVNWRKGYYSIENERAFIASLQRNLNKCNL